MLKLLFPTLLVSCTVLTIWLKAVDPLINPAEDPTQVYVVKSAKSSFQDKFRITQI